MLARRRNAYRARSVRDSATTLTATSMHSWSSGPRGSPAKGARFLRWSSIILCLVTDGKARSATF
jgi:hypothetical protein